MLRIHSLYDWLQIISLNLMTISLCLIQYSQLKYNQKQFRNITLCYPSCVAGIKLDVWQKVPAYKVKYKSATQNASIDWVVSEIQSYHTVTQKSYLGKYNALNISKSANSAGQNSHTQIFQITGVPAESSEISGQFQNIPRSQNAENHYILCSTNQS